jgi:hypothetical protein
LQSFPGFCFYLPLFAEWKREGEERRGREEGKREKGRERNCKCI